MPQMGVINILNRAYIVLRSGVADRRVRASLDRNARFKIAQFAPLGPETTMVGIALLEPARHTVFCLIS